jgi:6-phosphogluconolactonase (cycloisomerase 2 family)
MPHSVVFASDGSVTATDVGCDRVSSLSLGEAGSLSLKKHWSAAQGSGPANIVAHPAVRIIFVAGRLDPVVSSVRIGVASDASLTIVNALRLSSADGGISGLAIHPTGQVLFAADATTIRSVLVDDTGRLEESTIIQRTDGIIDLAVSREGAYLFGLTNTGAVTRLAIESRLSGLRRPVEVASVMKPTSMALKHC